MTKESVSHVGYVACYNNNSEIINFLVKKAGWGGVHGTGEEEKDLRVLLALQGLFHENDLAG